MATVSEEQKRIALLLMHDPKTAEQLNEQLEISFDRLNLELKDMLKKDVLKKEGFPTKYSLNPKIAEAVRQRKDISDIDTNKLRLKISIEAQAIEESLLVKGLKDMEEALRKEKDFTVYDCVLEKTIKQDEHYVSFLEANLSVKDFRALMRLVFFYGPTTVEVLKPDKFVIPLDDLQDGLVDAADMIHNYNQYIIKSMSRQELSEFTKKLYGMK